MDIIQLALNEELFSYHGEVYDFPPPGIPDRGGTVQELTLIPRPLYPYETWQAIIMHYAQALKSTSTV